MIKPSKAYLLIFAALLLPVLALSATGAFAFSFPQGSVVAGPGLGLGGPTMFNTYSHDVTTLGTGAAAGVAADAGASPSLGYSTGAGLALPFGPACPAIPGCGCGVPYGPLGPIVGPSAFATTPFSAEQGASQQVGSQALEDNTFATSFYNGGGLSPFDGLCNACISGNSPQQFTLQFF
jgi:hypothetical protein